MLPTKERHAVSGAVASWHKALGPVLLLAASRLPWLWPQHTLSSGISASQEKVGIKIARTDLEQPMLGRQVLEQIGDPGPRLSILPSALCCLQRVCAHLIVHT